MILMMKITLSFLLAFFSLPIMAQTQFEWLDTAEYPFEAHFFEVNGHRMHYIDEGRGQTLLFVHGTPSWSFDWRHVIRSLRTDFRCIAIDHIGFGLSDKPKEYDYNTQTHAKTLEQFVLANDLRNITLVVHDFGGPIGLSVAIRHPERFVRIIILNSWLWSSEADPDYVRIRRILKSPLLPFLYKRLNFSPRFILPQSFGDKKLSRHLLRQYTRPFANSSQRQGALAFAYSLLNDQGWFESLWQQKTAISTKPTLLVWGLKDPVIRPAHLDKFLTGFDKAQVVRMPSCGHFPQEEEPAAVSAAIRAFIGTGAPER